MKNKLAEYIDTHPDQATLARALDVSPVLVSLWVNDLRRPNLDNAFKIQRETGIPAEYWTTLPEAGRAETVTTKAS